MFKNPFSFNGRIRRLEYGIGTIISYAVLYICELITELTNEYLIGALVSFIIFIGQCWFSFAQNAKRCRDLGKSGWYQPVPFYVFWLLFDDSNYGINEYGPNAKGIGNIEKDFLSAA